MVSGDAGSARVVLGPAIADMPANAIARIVLFLSSMIGLLIINWRRSRRGSIGPNEAIMLDYVGFVAMRHIAVQCNNGIVFVTRLHVFVIRLRACQRHATR